MEYTPCYGDERDGRYFSEEFEKWYDLFRCKTHGYHVDVDWDNVW